MKESASVYCWLSVMWFLLWLCLLPAVTVLYPKSIVNCQISIVWLDESVRTVNTAVVHIATKQFKLVATGTGRQHQLPAFICHPILFSTVWLLHLTVLPAYVYLTRYVYLVYKSKLPPVTRGVEDKNIIMVRQQEINLLWSKC